MFLFFSLLVVAIAIGQISIRLVAKSTLPPALLLAIKTALAFLLVLSCTDIPDDLLEALHLSRSGVLAFLFPAKLDAVNDDGEGSVLWKHCVSLAVLSLGLFIGESFCPITLTGSIATGKSTVAQMLLSSSSSATAAGTSSSADVYLIDSDSIGHEILLPARVLAATSADTKDADTKYTVLPRESVYEDICQTFAADKDTFLDPDTGLIIRRKLGALIFSDNQKRRQLNRITHPRIIMTLVKRILYGVYIKRTPLCCADVPLLFESGSLRMLFCLTVVVATSPDLQYQRLRERNKDLSEEECRDRIQSQFPMERKVAGADIVIWNNGNMGELETRVRAVKNDLAQRLHGGLSFNVLVLLVGVALLVYGDT
jgi:dephospho-CoA kinase